MSHRRRNVGVGRARTGKGVNGYSKIAGEIKATSITSAMETVKKLEIKLTDFAKKHRTEIQNDPAFRAKFLEMCGPLGVDPLSSEKGFWGNMLGIGEFYYELAVKVAEVCIASRSRNGGIISVAEVKQILKQRGTKFNFSSSSKSATDLKKSHTKYSTQDIITAIGKLSKLGSGFRTVMVGTHCMIVSIPMELDNDHMEIMKLAQGNEDNDKRGNISGMVTMYEIKKTTGWEYERANRAMAILLGNGMAWLDIYNGQKYYWFPSVWKEGIDDIVEDDI